MKCLKCGSEKLIVFDTRAIENNNTRRRRRCLDCGHKFSTIEMPISNESVHPITDWKIEMKNEAKKEMIELMKKEFKNVIASYEQLIKNLEE